MTEFNDLPFWHLGVEKFSTSSDNIPKNSDVVIVGVGFTGLATALHLLRAGKSVVLFDAMKLGDGASGKNGGMVGPSLHKLGLDGLTNQYGREKAIDILQEGMSAISYFQEFVRSENIDCDFKMTGRFRGITNQKALDGVLRDSENLLALKGFKFDQVKGQDVQSEIGSELYKGGVIYHQDGGLHPFKLQTAIARKVVELGGSIYQETPVGNIMKTPTGFQVETTKGTLTGKSVV